MTDLARSDAAIRQALTGDVLAQIQQLAPIAHASRLFGTSSPEQAAMIMATGWELGLPLMAAYQNIYSIEGKLSIAPKMGMAQILRSGLLADLKITETPDSCTVTMTRRNGNGTMSYTASFSLADAKRAGLTEGSPRADGQKRLAGNWEKYPANMMRWRAIGYCADVLFPDVLLGMMFASSLGADVNEAGDVINVDPTTGEVIA